MKTKLFFNLILFVVLSLPLLVAAQTTNFTYQGRLTDSNAVANGNFDFQIGMYSAATGGSAVLTFQRNALVTNGVFTLTLGLPTLFANGSDYYLEIRVKPMGSTDPYTVLAPRQQILSAPYAVRSLNSGQLGGIPANQYVQTNDDRLTDARLPLPDSNEYIQNLSTNGPQQNFSSFNIGGNGKIAGNLTVNGTLTADLPSGDVDYIQNRTTPQPITNFNISGNGTIGGTLNANDGRFSGTVSGSQVNSSGNGLFSGTLSAINLTVAVGGSFGGNLTVGGTLTANLPSGDANYIQNRTTQQTGATNFNVSGNGTLGGMLAANAVNATTQFNIGGQRVLSIAGTRNVFVGTTAGIVNTGTDNAFFGGNAGGTNTSGGSNTFVGRNAGDLNTTGNNNTVVGANADLSTTNLSFATAVGAGAVVSTNNTIQLGRAADTVRASILQITGGSDLAENFEIDNGEKSSAAMDEVKPGMVVAIDPRNAGKLALARGTYNRRVAGIISGANNLSAGMLLPNLSTAENSMPLALSGRVWVYADATKNPIIPGDLLTTSNTPGHAMKATNYKKAQGAIIGKAMSELKSGKGLILVLITLQ